MSNGICLVAQNNATTDYIKQAYALALSVLGHSPRTNISLITNDEVPNDYKTVFDKIISIPWGDLAEKNDWKIDNRWKVYHVSPYENTLVFDVDMLVLEDISKNWQNFKTSAKLQFTKNVKTFRNELVTSRYYRKTFDSNNLPDVYSGMYQFTKCEETLAFFNLLDVIMQNWQTFYKEYASKDMQKWCSVDLSIAIALKILGIEGYSLDYSPMTFTHMKPHAQNFVNPPQKWTDVLPVDLNDKHLYINGYKQTGVLHYVEDEFLTDEVIAWLKEKI